MQHKNRTWNVTSVTSPFELTTQLTEYRHCLYQGFRIRRYLFLNDSRNADEATYAVCLDDVCSYNADPPPIGCTIYQIETRDFAYLDYSDAWNEVNAVLSGRYDFYHIDSIARHRIHYPPNCFC